MVNYPAGKEKVNRESWGWWWWGNKECVKGYRRVGEFARGFLIQGKEPQAAVLGGWGLMTCPSSNITLFFTRGRQVSASLGFNLPVWVMRSETRCHLFRKYLLSTCYMAVNALATGVQ